MSSPSAFGPIERAADRRDLWRLDCLRLRAFLSGGAREQDQLAARILDEVACETSLEGGAGREKLRQMIDQARADIRASRVREFRPEDL